MPYDVGICSIITFFWWGVFYITMFIYSKLKYNTKTSARKLGLYIFLFFVFLLSIIGKYLDLSEVYKLYTPFSIRIENYNLQQILESTVKRYSELIIDWSLIQGLICSLLEDEKPYEKLNELFGKINKKIDIWIRTEKCSHCGELFIANTKDDDICDKCKEEIKKNENIIKICSCCGKPFATNNNDENICDKCSEWNIINKIEFN